MPFIGRTRDIQEAPIQRLLAESKIPSDVISLGQGVPFFPPPPVAVKASQDAAATPSGYRYSEDAGRLELRALISKKLREENRISADPERNICVTQGGNQAFVNAMTSITDVGDEVILLAPYYFNHFMALQMAGVTPVLADCDPKHQPIPGQIAGKISERTRAVVTVSPNNPTGAVYEPALLKEINAICAEKGIYHISDEAYEHFVFDRAKHVSPGSYDKAIEHTISLYSFSKSFGMPGYRIGYMAYPEALHEDILKVQDTVAICPSGPAQAAAEQCLKATPRYPRQFIPNMAKVRDIIRKGVKELDNIRMPVTMGGYYFFLRLECQSSCWDISKDLIERFGVITIPGSVFGAPYPSLRISYGNIDAKLAEEGMARLTKGLRELLGKN